MKLTEKIFQQLEELRKIKFSELIFNYYFKDFLFKIHY